jgi:hypothetical protein
MFLKTERRTEMKLTPLEGKLQKTLTASGSSGVTSTMATRSATVGMAENSDSFPETVLCVPFSFHEV